MKPWQILDRVQSPGGELVLCRREEVWVIRLDGEELMTSRTHGSEEALAELGCAGLATRPGACVLVGGLGLGFTLRATLDRLGPQGEVVVAELVPEVVRWNRELLAPLHGGLLDDPRVTVEVGDVAGVVAGARARFDAVLLDVDNGPRALCHPDNRRLYSPAGIAALDRALRPGGRVVIWSASPDDAFVQQLRRAGRACRSETVSARRGNGTDAGPRHTLFVLERG